MRPRPARDARHARDARPSRILTATLLATALVLSACGGSDDPTPAPSPAPAPAPAPAPGQNGEAPTEVVAVYVVRSGPTEFFVEPVPVSVEPFGDATSARITAAVDALLALTDLGEEGLTSSVPEGTTLHGVAVDGAVVTLDLSGGIVGSTGSSSQERMLAQQLAHTVRVDEAITAVRLVLDGAPVTELWGHLDWSAPVEADPFALSPITVTTPLEGEEVAVGTVTFRGQATVVEANVLVSLLDASGAVVEEGFVTASEGAPDRGTWEWTVTLPAAGSYTVVASEDDLSDGEGRPAFVAMRTVTATG